MSESFITLKLSVEETHKSIRLIEGFQKLRESRDIEEDAVRNILNEYFGISFADIIFAELITEEDVL